MLFQGQSDVCVCVGGGHVGQEDLTQQRWTLQVWHGVMWSDGLRFFFSFFNRFFFVCRQAAIKCLVPIDVFSRKPLAAMMDFLNNLLLLSFSLDCDADELARGF